ncbi:MAG: hypothetical protein QM695_14380 [Micropruina sp.]
MTDSRAGLVTSYTYTGTGPELRLATITPPGLAPFTFEYGAGKLAKVTRPNPASAGGGTAQLAAYVYNQPLTGVVPDLPNLATETTKWGQASKPTQAFAVFGQDQPINGTPGNGDQAWKAADLQFTDAQGYTVNRAIYGAGSWQITAAEYDALDNVVMAWDARATAAIRAGQISAADAPYAATRTLYDSTGTMVTDTYGPARQVVAANGTLKTLRTHVKTQYDQGAPNGNVNPSTGDAYGLPTTVTVTAESISGTVDATVGRTFSGYGALAAGDKTGWELGQATSTTVDMDNSNTINAGDITRKTRYDSRGRIIEQRQPLSSGTDAGTRTTTYYTGSATGAIGCVSKPEWAGMACKVAPASGATLPTTDTTSYTWNLQNAESTESSGTASITTTTAFDSKDRPTTVTTTASGLSGSQSVPAVTTIYDNATGLVTGTNSSAGDTLTTYDNWGRKLSYSNTVGSTVDQSTTTYDAANRVTSVIAGPVETKYTYDGINARGQQERRGLVTKVETRLSDGAWITSSGAHDAGGALVVERLPGKITRTTDLDITGSLSEASIRGYVGTTADQIWLTWSSRSNALGQVVQERTSPASSLGVAVPVSTTSYRYDFSGRLVRVDDSRNSQCAVRIYGYDPNGNRTTQTEQPAAASCPTSGGTTTTHVYDAADRPSTGANGSGTYGYDLMGRQITVPSSDAPTASGGSIAIEYDYADSARSISQGGTTQAFSLDGAARRWTQTTTSSSGTSTLQRHYTNDSDNPTWTLDNRNGTDTTTIYSELISGYLAVTATAIGSGTPSTAISISGPRGDNATEIPVAAGSEGLDGTPIQPEVLTEWNEYDEFGQPKQTPPTNTPGGISGVGYGWLGIHERATLDNGLILMGARLYNPATALFTSLDPVMDGNDTSYGYPSDPINKTDISGMFVPAAVAFTPLGILAVSFGPLGWVAVAAVVAVIVVTAIVTVKGNSGKTMTRRVRIVPKPAKTSHRANKTYIVYEIFGYLRNGKRRTWKYGISSVPGGKRPSAQIGRCNADRLFHDCDWKAKKRNIPGYHAARWWEYAYIRQYQRTHGGFCPRGQWHSCK